MNRVNYSLLITFLLVAPVISYILYKKTIYTKEYANYAKAIIKKCQPFVNTQPSPKKSVNFFSTKELKPKRITIKSQTKRVSINNNLWKLKEKVIIEIENHKIQYKAIKKSFTVKKSFKRKKPFKLIHFPLKLYKF